MDIFDLLIDMNSQLFSNQQEYYEDLVKKYGEKKAKRMWREGSAQDSRNFDPRIPSSRSKFQLAKGSSHNAKKK